MRHLSLAPDQEFHRERLLHCLALLCQATQMLELMLADTDVTAVVARSPRCSIRTRRSRSRDPIKSECLCPKPEPTSSGFECLSPSALP